MNPELKINLNQKLESGEPIRLNLGCGHSRKDGYIQVDAVSLPNVDVVCDLNDGLPFLPNNSVDEVFSSHFLEHLDDPAKLIAEAHRVLKPDGLHHAIVPHHSSPYFYSDFTHKTVWGLYSFFYFSPLEKQYSRKVPNFYTSSAYEVVELKLQFRGHFFLTKAFRKLFGLIVNSAPVFQEYYEQSLCRWVPCEAVEVKMKPIKN